jgi:hypothetical protein
MTIPLYILYSCSVVWWQFEDTKGVSRSRKSKKDRQFNDQKKKYNRTNNDLQDRKLKIEQHDPH